MDTILNIKITLVRLAAQDYEVIGEKITEDEDKYPI